MNTNTVLDEPPDAATRPRDSHEPPRKRRAITSRRAALRLSFAITAAACGGTAAATDREPARAEAPDPAPVRVARVQEELVSPPIIAAGALGPKEEIALSFKVGGVVERITVDAGEAVRAGDTLAALDPVEIEAAVSRARSAAEKAERDLERARRLHAGGVLPLAQLQDAETAAQIARADLAAALFNRRHAVIAAPAAGVILRRAAEPGELLAPGVPVLVLGSHARGAVVRVGLADRDVVRVRRGDAAVIRFDALPARAFEGRISEVAAAAEPGTGTYAVEIAVAGAGGLPAGLVGHVEIHPADRSRALLVPAEALLEADGEEATVFALSADGRRAERRRVTIAFIAGGRVAVRAGLDGVAAVITEGAAYLEDGAAVRVLP
ncbi:MAG TPA: efflux RND transporter periplasmic adaptor subunit [Longimicrobiales bacterium]